MMIKRNGRSKREKTERLSDLPLMDSFHLNHHQIVYFRLVNALYLVSLLHIEIWILRCAAFIKCLFFQKGQS